MCDFSLQHAKSRPAVVADKLQTKDFGRGTVGLAGQDETHTEYADMTAVCIRPGTELAFSETPKLRHAMINQADEYKDLDKVARFRQINLDQPSHHHDALEFPDGRIVMLTLFAPGQALTVLQLPAAPKTAAEEKAQERLPVTA